MQRALITDLDNTLYDWAGYFIPSFQAMVRELVRLTGLQEGVLLDSFKRVHQRHRTAEYAFAIEELDVLKEAALGDRISKYHTAIEAFRASRGELLRLYPGVLETLRSFQADGWKIIAHTDAMMPYAAARVAQLGLDEVPDGLIATEDHGVPSEVRAEHEERYRETAELDLPLLESLPDALRKPNPAGILRVLEHLDIAPKEAVYVGDSLTRDIRMAQEAGVVDVFASYGVAHLRSDYALLVSISHWTAEDVAQEKLLSSQDVRPSHVIHEFADLAHLMSVPLVSLG